MLKSRMSGLEGNNKKTKPSEQNTLNTFIFMLRQENGRRYACDVHDLMSDVLVEAGDEKMS